MNNELFATAVAMPADRLDPFSEQGNFWQALWENYPVPIFIVDAAGAELARNASAQEMMQSMSSTQISGLVALLRDARTRLPAGEQWADFKVTVSGSGTPPHRQGHGVWMVQLIKKPSLAARAGDLCRTFGLTQREAEVCALIIQGYSDKEVSKTLSIGFPTVRTHLSHAFTKIDVTSRAELIHKIAREC